LRALPVSGGGSAISFLSLAFVRPGGGYTR
jgi:hypothetical protein